MSMVDESPLSISVPVLRTASAPPSAFRPIPLPATSVTLNEWLMLATSRLRGRSRIRHEKRCDPGAWRRTRHPAVPVDQVPLQAGGAGGRQVSADRHPAVELHQQRPEPLLRADAVQLGQPAPPHPLHLHLRSVRRRLRRGAGRPADARQRRLVSGHGRRRAAEPPLRRAARHRIRADPLRRPTVPDELPGHDRLAHPGRRRRDDRRRAGA